jgi:glycosyltransferase involved in cell wall biosynthesis
MPAERRRIIVADNMSTDETAAIAQSRGCRVATSSGAVLLRRAMGAAIARGEILAFTDADMQVHPTRSTRSMWR